MNIIRINLALLLFLITTPVLADSLSLSYDHFGQVDTVTYKENENEAKMAHSYDTTGNRTRVAVTDTGGAFAPPSFQSGVCVQEGVTYKAMGLYSSRFEAMKARNVCVECNGNGTPEFLHFTGEANVGCLPAVESGLSAVACRKGDSVLVYYHP